MGLDLAALPADTLRAGVHVRYDVTLERRRVVLRLVRSPLPVSPPSAQTEPVQKGYRAQFERYLRPGGIQRHHGSPFDAG